jgi:hypothetical protein
MDLRSILAECLSPDSVKREQAEYNLDLVASQDFGSFLYNLSSELSEENVQKPIRQIAATVIKNMIVYSPKYLGHWEKLDNNVKGSIKERVLSTLASKEKDIRKAAALAVAGK